MFRFKNRHNKITHKRNINSCVLLYRTYFMTWLKKKKKKKEKKEKKKQLKQINDFMQ